MLTSTVPVSLFGVARVARALVASLRVIAIGVVWTGVGVALVDVGVTFCSCPARLAETGAVHIVTALSARHVACAIVSAVKSVGPLWAYCK